MVSFKRLTAALSLSVALFSGAAYAQDMPPLKVSGDVKAQYLYQDNLDLDQLNQKSNDSQALDARLKLSFSPIEALDLFTEVRGLKTFGNASVDSGDGVDEPSDSYFELRQYWARFNQPFGLVPANFQVGRQRINEPYGFWWNRDLDALRFNYDATLLSGFVGVGQNKASYRSGNDNDLAEDEQDRLRSLGELSYQWQKDHFIEGRFLHEQDQSGRRAIGTILSTGDTDESDAALTWIGGRVRGDQGPIQYRFDLAGVTGTDRVENTSALGSFRQVTSTPKQDVSAWALDTSVGYVFLNTIFNPTVLVGYAYGSGDDNAGDNKNKAFRQTDLQSNSSLVGGSSRTIRNYGEVFRPELSNLHILTLNLGLNTTVNSDLNFIYHAYRRVENATGLGSDGLSVNPSANSSDIGQEVDVVYNLDLADVPAFNVTAPATHSARFSIGAFKAGDAYGVSADEVTVRGLVEWRMQF